MRWEARAHARSDVGFPSLCSDGSCRDGDRRATKFTVSEASFLYALSFDSHKNLIGRTPLPSFGWELTRIDRCSIRSSLSHSRSRSHSPPPPHFGSSRIIHGSAAVALSLCEYARMCRACPGRSGSAFLGLEWIHRSCPAILSRSIGLFVPSISRLINSCGDR
jgi:hypothetical protein